MMFRRLRWCLLLMTMLFGLASCEVQLTLADKRAIDSAQQDFARLEQVWAPYLSVRGVRDNDVRLYFVTPAQAAQPCGDDLYFVSHNAAACQSVDDGYHVIIPVRYAAQLYGGAYGKGRLSKVPARALLAHEYGHIVQFLLIRQFALQAPKEVQQELLADCLAGAAIHEIYGFRWSLPGNRAVGKWYDTIGDPEGVHSHGTAVERHNAFDFGYGAGMYGVTYCFQKFWPNAIGL